MEEEIKKSRLAEELQGVSLPDKRFLANVISIAGHLSSSRCSAGHLEVGIKQVSNLPI